MRKPFKYFTSCCLALFIAGCATQSKYAGGEGTLRGYEGLSEYSDLDDGVVRDINREGNTKANTTHSTVKNTAATQPVSTTSNITNESLLGGMKDSEALRRATMRPYTVRGKTYQPREARVGENFDGIASWYGPNFHAKSTSNGETYNMHAHTAAHKTLPMNTIVKVYNKDNGRTTIVRINDRGPFVEGRIIDLSNVAARDIDMVKQGVANVRLEVIGFGPDMLKNGGIVTTQTKNENPQQIERSHVEQNRKTTTANQEKIQQYPQYPQQYDQLNTTSSNPPIQTIQEPNQTQTMSYNQQYIIQPTPPTKAPDIPQEIKIESKTEQKNESPIQTTQNEIPKQEQIAQQESQDDKIEKNIPEESIISDNIAIQPQQDSIQEVKDLQGKIGELEQKIKTLENEKKSDKNTQELQDKIQSLEEKIKSIEDTKYANNEASNTITIGELEQKIKTLENEKESDRNTQELQYKIQSLEEKIKSIEDTKYANNEASSTITNSMPQTTMKDAPQKDTNIDIDDKQFDDLMNDLANTRNIASNTNNIKREPEIKQEPTNEIPNTDENAATQNKEENKLPQNSTHMVSLNVFSTEQRAKNYIKEHESMTHNGRYMLDIIHTDDGLYRVALRGFKSYDEAKNFIGENNLTGYVMKEK